MFLINTKQKIKTNKTALVSLYNYFTKDLTSHVLMIKPV